MTKEILVTYIDPDGPDHGTSSWLDTFDGLQMTESNLSYRCRFQARSTGLLSVALRLLGTDTQ